jgi:hypothetical protein
LASIYSKQLFLGDAPSGGTTVLYTAPTGIVAIVRSIHMIPFGGGTPWTMFWEINSTFFDYFDTTVSTASYDVETRLVLNPGDELKLETGTGGWSGVVSGYELVS